MNNKKLKIIIVLVILGTIIGGILYKMLKKNSYESGWVYNPNEISENSSSTGKGGASISNLTSAMEGVTSFGAVTSSASIMGSASDMTGAAKSFRGVSNNDLGFSTGGAKTIKNFRENIKNDYFPLYTDITYNGLFYDYSFDTGNSGKESNDLFYPSYSTAVSKDPISGENEYYMTVGLNSNIKEKDFKRPKLNLVVVLDNSGSMESPFDSYYYDNNIFKRFSSGNNKSKMEIANDSVNILIDKLNKDDRFGMVIFNSQGHIAKYLSEIGETDVYDLKSHISEIEAMGGTNFEDGYRKALEIFDELDTDNDEYQNRIIVITDAMPNVGTTSKNGLMSMVEESSKNKIYTSFIGVGVDFNTELVEKIGTVTGANYYSVHDAKEFKDQMGEDFDYMVTPLVFDLNLDFDSDDYILENVYGTDVEDNKKDNIMHVNTLFPSKRNDDGEVKGGIILLKLKKKDEVNDGKISLKVSYKDRNGEEHSNEQGVNFDRNGEYYDNTGIRKGIVLTRYVNALKDWILYERCSNREYKDKLLYTEKTGIVSPVYEEDEIIKILGENERTSVRLKVSEESKELFEKLYEYIKSEKDEIGDNTMKQELDVLDKLINV